MEYKSHKEQDKENTIQGMVSEALPNTLFRVSVTGGSQGEKEILAYLSGSMRLHHIRVLVGDRVQVKLDPYGGKGRIIKRL